MSKYLEDIQGRIDSNPINETNTKYPYIKSHGPLNQLSPGYQHQKF